MSSDQSLTSDSQSEQPWRRVNRKFAVVALSTAIIVIVGSVYALGLISTTSKHTRNSRFVVGTPTSTSGISGHPVGSGYLSIGSGHVAFIEWNNRNGTVSGTEELVTSTGQAPILSTQSQSIEVFGTITGSTISLELDFGARVFGTFSGNSMTINLPRQNGTLAPWIFKRATAAEFNNAVSQFHEKGKITNDVKIVNTDLADLNTSQFSTASISVLAALQAEAEDLSSTKTGEQTVLLEVNSASGRSRACMDALIYVANGARDNVASVATIVESRATNGIVEDIQSLEGGIQKLKADFAQLQTDEQTLATFTPQGAPTQGQIDQAISATSVAISTAISTTNGDITQANAYVTKAFQYVDEAYQAGNCGTPPTAPSPQKPIS